MDVPAFSDIALRRAIFTAVNAGDIAERIYGELYPEYTLRTNHTFPAASPYHEDHLADTGFGNGDVEAAQAILEDAGYTTAGHQPRGGRRTRQRRFAVMGWSMISGIILITANLIADLLYGILDLRIRYE